MKMNGWFFLLVFVACRPALETAPMLDAVHFSQARDEATLLLRRACGDFALREATGLGTLAALEFVNAARLFPATRAASVSTTVRDFLLRYRTLFGLADDDTLDYETSVIDALGMRRVLYTQKRAGLPVWGSQLTAHMRGPDDEMELVRIFGRLFPLVTLATASAQPALSSEAARQQALSEARTQAPVADLSAYAPDLYYRADAERLHLVYRVEVYGQTRETALRFAYFIDAHDGSVRALEDLVAHLDVTLPANGQGRGALGASYGLSVSQRDTTYYLQDPTRGSQRATRVSPGEKLPGRTVTSADPDHFDEDAAAAPGMAVDVFAHLTTLWDYFAASFDYYGVDGKGHGIVAVTHFGSHENLAMFDGERILFGEGDGKDFAPLGAGFDIVAHEYAHALLRKSAGLLGARAGGGLDEGLANLFACFAEKNARPKTGNWTIGEEVYHPGGHPGVLADLSDPTGGIAYVGYLVGEKLGVADAGAIFFRAVTTYLSRYADVSDAKDALSAAAFDLKGEAGRTLVKESFARAGLP